MKKSYLVLLALLSSVVFLNSTFASLTPTISGKDMKSTAPILMGGNIIVDTNGSIRLNVNSDLSLVGCTTSHIPDIYSALVTKNESNNLITNIKITMKNKSDFPTSVVAKCKDLYGNTKDYTFNAFLGS